MFFFQLPSVVLDLLLIGVLMGATLLGALVGRRSRHRSDTLMEPTVVLQGALLGIVGLLLAFGLSLAVSRYEGRRANVVAEANAIGTTFLRAQTLEEPARSTSMDLLIRFTRNAIAVSDRVPGSSAARAAVAREAGIERRLWALAAAELQRAPVASAPRLYVPTLNEMFDDETARVVALSNRVPTAVLVLEVLAAAFALAVLAAYLAIAGRGELTAVLASCLVAFLMIVTTDLDRPTRGLIRGPDDPPTPPLASLTAPPA